MRILTGKELDSVAGGKDGGDKKAPDHHNPCKGKSSRGHGSKGGGSHGSSGSSSGTGGTGGTVTTTTPPVVVTTPTQPI
jgi:hypothetical protein